MTAREKQSAHDAWREQVEAVLKGASFDRKLVSRTYDDLAIQPLYDQSDALPEQWTTSYPGDLPNNRGSRAGGNVVRGWDIRARQAHADVGHANRQIHEDLAGGCHSLLLRFDHSSCGLDQDGPEGDKRCDGLMITNLNDLETLLTGVSFTDCGLALDAGSAFLPAAALLVALCRRRDLDPGTLHGSFGADPFGALAREGGKTGRLEQSLADMVELAGWSLQNTPQMRPVWISTSAYHNAGASSAWDLGIAMATGIAYLRQLTASGMNIDIAARQIGFSLSVGCRLFQATAKLRAAQVLWARVVNACGGDIDSGAMPLHVKTARRVITQRDPWTNMLRNTTCCFAAALAGAQAVTSEAFDSAGGQPGTLGRRIARNTQVILREESNLHRVVDPTGGSWFVESLTDRMARRGWQVMQQIEARGGMAACLGDGWLATKVEQVWRERYQQVVTQKDIITGVSLFANPDEEPVVQEQPDLRSETRRARQPEHASIGSENSRVVSLPGMVAAAMQGASLATLLRPAGADLPARIQPFPCRPDAEPFEQLRDAADDFVDKNGSRPTVFLANLGPIAKYVARTAYTRDFFQVGGFAVVESGPCETPEQTGENFANSGAAIAVICTADDLYDSFVAAVSRLLKQRGARTVILAGRPDDRRQSWAEAGLDRYIHQGCDVCATLASLLRQEGVQL